MVPVLPISTQARGLPWGIQLTEADGGPAPCVVKPGWIRIVEHGFLGPWIAALPDARWPEIQRALLDVLGLAP
jgi:mRNA-degrading endonuclease toxin of MazEF toxin-antitoxin module